MITKPLHLGVNIDHVATVRQARKADEPDPVWAAVQCELAGANGITVHLRQDRRHICDRDVRLLLEGLTAEACAEDDLHIRILLKQTEHVGQTLRRRAAAGVHEVDGDDLSAEEALADVREGNLPLRGETTFLAGIDDGVRQGDVGIRGARGGHRQRPAAAADPAHH